MYRALREQLEKIAAATPCRLTGTGCLGPCELGATVLIYPGGVLYGRVTPGDVPEIIAEHVLGGRRVTRLIVEDVDA